MLGKSISVWDEGMKAGRMKSEGGRKGKRQARERLRPERGWGWAAGGLQ